MVDRRLRALPVGPDAVRLARPTPDATPAIPAGVGLAHTARSRRADARLTSREHQQAPAHCMRCPTEHCNLPAGLMHGRAMDALSAESKAGQLWKCRAIDALMALPQARTAHTHTAYRQCAYRQG